MSSISTLAEIVVTPPAEPDDTAGGFPGTEPYSELLLETLEAADIAAGESVDVRSSESANTLFGNLLDNWQ